MARRARLVVAGYPHMVVLQGNRAAIALDDADRVALLAELKTAAANNDCAIHAYALLEDRLLLLLSPAVPDALARLVQALGRGYVAAFNHKHRLRGTLWEGRFRSGVIDPKTWLLACTRFVESAPVAAGLVRLAEEFRWSSARHHLGLALDPLLSDHASYWALGNTPFEREAAYREYLEQGVPAEHAQMIPRSALHGWALGPPEFIDRIQCATGQPARPRSRGRPPRTLSVPN